MFDPNGVCRAAITLQSVVVVVVVVVVVGVAGCKHQPDGVNFYSTTIHRRNFILDFVFQQRRFYSHFYRFSILREEFVNWRFFLFLGFSEARSGTCE